MEARGGTRVEVKRGALGKEREKLGLLSRFKNRVGVVEKSLQA